MKQNYIFKYMTIYLEPAKPPSSRYEQAGRRLSHDNICKCERHIMTTTKYSNFSDLHSNSQQLSKLIYKQGWRDHLAVYYTSP